MATDTLSPRETLALFVAGGNLRDTEPSPKIPPERVKLIKQRQQAILAGENPPSASDSPSDFRSAISQKEEEADQRERASRGVDLPRGGKWANHPVMKHLYRAHDTIASLPAPGGLALIIVVIFVLWLFLIPVGKQGETRANLLWDVILGKKTLPGPSLVQPVTAISSQSAKGEVQTDLNLLGVTGTLTDAQGAYLLQIVNNLAGQGLTSGQFHAECMAQIQAYLNSQGIATPGATNSGNSGQGYSVNTFAPVETAYYPDGMEGDYGY